jgi:single-strand DNA-binding protein
MNGMNKVIIMGYLGSDPKGQLSKDGKAYTSLSLATNRSWVNKDGAKEKRTDWHRVTVWGKKAQICQDYLKKGAPVCIEGYLSSFEIEENGQRRWLTSITAEDINFLPSRDQAH